MVPDPQPCINVLSCIGSRWEALSIRTNRIRQVVEDFDEDLAKAAMEPTPSSLLSTPSFDDIIHDIEKLNHSYSMTRKNPPQSERSLTSDYCLWKVDGVFRKILSTVDQIRGIAGFGGKPYQCRQISEDKVEFSYIDEDYVLCYELSDGQPGKRPRSSDSPSQPSTSDKGKGREKDTGKPEPKRLRKGKKDSCPSLDISKSSNNSKGRRFACHFHKYNPTEWPDCGCYENLAKLKDHLNQSHFRIIQCSNCGARFDRDSNLARHQGIKRPCVSQAFEGVAEEDIKRSNFLKKSSGGGSLSWREIWISLFGIDGGHPPYEYCEKKDCRHGCSLSLLGSTMSTSIGPCSSSFAESSSAGARSGRGRARNSAPQILHQQAPQGSSNGIQQRLQIIEEIVRSIASQQIISQVRPQDSPYESNRALDQRGSIATEGRISGLNIVIDTTRVSPSPEGESENASVQSNPMIDTNLESNQQFLSYSQQLGVHTRAPGPLPLQERTPTPIQSDIYYEDVAVRSSAQNDPQIGTNLQQQYNRENPLIPAANDFLYATPNNELDLGDDILDQIGLADPQTASNQDGDDGENTSVGDYVTHGSGYE